MKRFFTMMLVISAVLGVAACSSPKEPEPEKQPMTTREKAKAVGKLSDSIMTKNLEKNLVNVVDSSEERAKRLEKAAEEE